VFVSGVLGAGTKAAAAREAGGGLGGDETVLLGEMWPRGMRLGMKFMADV
jgi:hypothetical protein